MLAEYWKQTLMVRIQELEIRDEALNDDNSSACSRPCIAGASPLQPSTDHPPTRTHSQKKQQKSLELEMKAAINHEPEGRHGWAIQ